MADIDQFEKAIMAAYTSIFKENVLHVLLRHIRIHILFYAVPQFLQVLRLLEDGLAKLNQGESGLPSKNVLDRIEEAIKSGEHLDIVEATILDAYKVFNKPQVSIFLLEKIDKYTKELHQARLSEVYTIITNTFERMNSGDDSFAPPLGQPENLNKFYRDEITACMKRLFEIAQSKVCLKIILFHLIYGNDLMLTIYGSTGSTGSTESTGSKTKTR